MKDFVPKMNFAKFREHLSGSVYTHWIGDVHAGLSPEDVLEPVYWQNVARQLKEEDVIEARAEDGAWRLYLRVRYVEGADAILAIDSGPVFYDLSAPAETDGNFVVKWISPPRKWGIVHKDTKEIFQADFQTKEQAQRHLLNMKGVKVA